MAETTTEVHDTAGDELVDAAVALAGEWIGAADRATSRRQRRLDAQLHALMNDPESLRVAMAFLDRVMRAPDNDVAAAQLNHLVARRGVPGFLPAVDRLLLRTGAALAPKLPGAVIPLARKRLRALTDHLIVAAEDRALRHHLKERQEQSVATNLNRLGEAILGEGEARRRFEVVLDLVGRPDVDYLSVKVSAITSRINLWAFETTLDRICVRLRELYRAAAAHGCFVNLDMEEYTDVELTLAAFRRVLSEDEHAGLDAGIVLQAYLPDSYGHLRELLDWADHRHRTTGGTIKVRIVKGANLAMELVDAEVHGWTLATYPTKADVDASWKRMVDWALTPGRLGANRIGVGSHNLFDVAWAHLLAERRGVAAQVEFEMLEGMALLQSRQVHEATGTMLLYTPIVARQDFPSAIAYLFRRLEENAAPTNFLRHLFDMAPGSDAFGEQRAAFEASVARRWEVPEAPRRRQHRLLEQPVFDPADAFTNEPDTDPALAHNRAWMASALDDWTPPAAPPTVDTLEGVDAVVARAAEAATAWRRRSTTDRRRRLERLAEVIAASRGEVVATMAGEAGKVVAQGDPEVSEAVDFARWYGRSIVDLDALDGVAFDPLGVVVVTPPWNFPFAIPTGGVCAALAAGNAVVLKPAPQTPLTAAHVQACCDQAGLPAGLVQVIQCPENEVGRRLITHPEVGAVVLTGAWETARLFGSWRPDLHLLAETSGKNAMIITARADLDAAVADLVASAFGHAGQKCSAASLAIVEGELYDTDAFRRQLTDATTSLVVGDSRDLASDVGPLIGPPGDDLARALDSLEPGETWLVPPRRLSDDRRQWRPGVRLGVQPGSWFHHTECFGPVLGVMRAENLDQAIEWQNQVAYGLTGGIWTLDPDQVATWRDRVEVGNAYVNRVTTGAIVGRQPFGGWKRSVVGPGAKAGGPNYVAQLGNWRDDGAVERRAEPAPAVRAALDRLAPGLDADEMAWLTDAIESDAYWLAEHFAVAHDFAGLRSESNVFRYRPLPMAVVRAGPDTDRRSILRVLLGAMGAGVPTTLSLPPGERPRFDLPGPGLRHETDDELAARLDLDTVRVRMLTPPSHGLRAAARDASVHLAEAPPLVNGRVELLHLFREQSVSTTLHRYGNLIGVAGDDPG